MKSLPNIKWLHESTLNAYSQVFFSNHLGFAYLLILVSFMSFNGGVAGLFSVLAANLMAYFMGFNEDNTRKGFYSFNALLVGLGLGVFYVPSIPLYIVLFFISVLCLFITLALEGIFTKYGLPYLSIPFLLALWIVILASRHFQALEIDNSNLYWMNEAYAWGGAWLLGFFEFFQNLPIPEALRIYFKSLGAIFFQYNILAGIGIALGLLWYSRISFVLSLLGFLSAYYYYDFIGADITELSYAYIGFNYILTAIAIGGYFVIPSMASYIWVILLIPIISFLMTSTSAFLSLFQLSIYSLPFNIVVILFIYILKLRIKAPKYLHLTLAQYGQAEKNRYRFLNYKDRFWSEKYLPIHLPFWGKWVVSQDHNGEYTHKEDWRHAWDFVIEDDLGKTYKNNGTVLTDYYCYKKAVLAVADGEVEKILDGIKDNAVGDVNLDENWGNTIIIKHAPYLYSKISHILKGSFKVNEGDKVKRGQLLAYCGNSGRSPEPHIHFQIQSTPFIGSKTLEYPIGNYLIFNKAKSELKEFSMPIKGDILSNMDKRPLLKQAFKWIPGQILRFSKEKDSSIKEINWEVHVDAYNQAYLYDKESQSFAYFKQDDYWHHFRSFIGDKNSELFQFYKAFYKVPLSYNEDIQIVDYFTLDEVNMSYFQWIQDLLVPFYSFIKAAYTLDFKGIDSPINPSKVNFSTKHNLRVGVNDKIEAEIDICIDEVGIKYWESLNQNCIYRRVETD